MSQRERLIERLKESGNWESAPPKLRKEIEQFDEAKANRWMVLQDALDSPEGYLDDADTETLALAFLLSSMQSAAAAFDGKLVEFEPGEKPRPSELGRALLEFTEVAKAHGFSSEAAIAMHMSSVTWELLRTLQRFAEADQP